MLGDAVEVAPCLREEVAGPVHGRSIERLQIPHVLAVVAVQRIVLQHAAGCDENDGRIYLAHGLGELVVLHHVVLGIRAPDLPGAPGLVADVPEPDVVGLRVSILRAQRTHGRAGGAVHVLDLFGGGVRVAQPGVHADVCLHADEPTEVHELVHAQVVGLHGAPGVVPVRRTLIRVADGVVPDEVGGVVAAVAPEAHVDLAEEGDDVGPEAVDVVDRHHRDRADVEVARTGAGDLQSGIRRIGGGGEVQREDFIGFADRHLDDLAVGVARAPHERNRDMRSGGAAQNNAAGVFLAVHQLEAGLAYAVRR